MILSSTFDLICLYGSCDKWSEILYW